MAKNKLDIGDVVAASMQQIVQSDEHKKTFFNKKASGKCCSCDSCNKKDCSCNSECAKECTACVKEKTSAINEVIDLLSKISTVQDELGLTRSSVTTMQALATMIVELKKNAGKDSNDVRYDELAEALEEEESNDYPEIMALLRQRIDESETGELSLPTDVFDQTRIPSPDFFDEVSADATSEFPSSNIFDDPDLIISPPDSGDLPTWGPQDEESTTDLPPRSLKMTDERVPVNRLPDVGKDIFGDDPARDLDPEYVSRTMPAAPMPLRERGRENNVEAFKRLTNLLTKQARDDEDFEDESEDTSFADDDLFEDEEGLEMLEEDGGYGFTYDLGDDTEMIRVPNGGKGELKRYRDLNGPERADLAGAMLFGDPLDIDPDELTNEEVYADEDWDLGDDTEDRMIEEIKDKQRNEWDEDGPLDKFFWDE